MYTIILFMAGVIPKRASEQDMSTTLCASVTSFSTCLLFAFSHKNKSRSYQNTRNMMFLATILTALAATQAAATVDDNGPTRNLKGRGQLASEEVAQPETTMTQKTKPRKILHSMHVPAESRIVGGSNAQQGEYPFFVQGNGCGGSLVWDDVVLTAAHCLGAFDGSVLVGPYIESSTSGGAESIDVVRQVPHPSYDSNSEAYDFMLLKLGNRVANPNLAPIAVNSVNNNPANNDVLTVIGFGATSEGGYGSSRLKEVNVNYIDYETCNNLYGGDIVDSVMLCAGVPGGGKDSCQGDSGGPIFDQEGTQVGVVSWGYGCAQAKFPGVYSRVSGVKDWIDARICELSSSPPASCGPTDGSSTETGSGNTDAVDSNTGDNEVVIEVTYDGFPVETGWTLRDSAGTLIAGQATGSFSTEDGTVSKTAFVAEGAYSFELTDTYGDGFCCDYGRGEFKITVNGEPVVTGSNGAFQDVTAETFNVVGLNAAPAAGDYRLDVAYDEYPYETSWSLQSLTTGAVVAASGFDEVTESGFFLSESVGLVPGDEYQLVILDSVGDGMCCAFGEGSIALYATVDGMDELITSSSGAFGTSQTNVFTVPDLAARSGNPKKEKQQKQKKAKKSKKNGSH
jgi:trypsin